MKTGARVRSRKISTKQEYPRYREHEIERLTDDDASRIIPRVESGVDKVEESEHHLQAVIHASHAAVVGGTVAQIYIPTPATLATTIQCDRLYPPRFSEPASYIRSSSTVEDCIGCPYCMTDADDQFLKSFNQKRQKAQQCREDYFEEVMNFFENRAHAKQPFAAVDNPPVVSYKEMEAALDDDDLDEEARKFASEIYEHWKDERLAHGNKPLIAHLKPETGQDTDDTDPYVCFRRREVRQTRKTRGRDAQVTEKLRSLRQELETARLLVAKVKERETLRREQLRVDKQIFEQRSAVRKHKQEHGIEGGDEDLINQKPAKRKREDAGAGQRQSGTNLRISVRPEGLRSSEQNLTTLQDILVQKENTIRKHIENQAAAHKAALRESGFVDLTWRPLTPPLEEQSQPSFRVAAANYLPTPPASVSSENSGDNLSADVGSPPGDRSSLAMAAHLPSPTDEVVLSHQRGPFRRRVGRGGRTWIDCRRMKTLDRMDIDDRAHDRFQFDHDDDDERPIYRVDPYNSQSIQRRAQMWTLHREVVPQPDLVRGQSQTGSQRRAVGPASNDVIMVNGRSAARRPSENRGTIVIQSSPPARTGS